jgi:hypothetical protein
MTTLWNWIQTHPRLSGWIALALGMCAILVWEARSVGLLWYQWIALLVVTTLVAGACVWIISIDDDEN